MQDLTRYSCNDVKHGSFAIGLLQLQQQYKKVEELYLAFAKRASTFNSWFENAEEDLRDPVRCNSLDEIQAADPDLIR